MELFIKIDEILKALKRIRAFDITKQLTCEVYAFVEATPISGPALM